MKYTKDATIIYDEKDDEPSSSHSTDNSDTHISTSTIDNKHVSKRQHNIYLHMTTHTKTTLRICCS